PAGPPRPPDRSRSGAARRAVRRLGASRRALPPALDPQYLAETASRRRPPRQRYGPAARRAPSSRRIPPTGAVRRAAGDATLLPQSSLGGRSEPGQPQTLAGGRKHPPDLIDTVPAIHFPSCAALIYGAG